MQEQEEFQIDRLEWLVDKLVEQGPKEAEIELASEIIQEVMKFFAMLGGIVKRGFREVMVKEAIMRSNIDHVKSKKRMTHLLEFIEWERKKDLHNLNLDNNKKLGHKKGSHYAKYEGTTRTWFRLMWFVEFLTEIFTHFAATPDMSFRECVKRAYDKALGPYHPFLLRAAVKAALVGAPSRKSIHEKIWRDCTQDKEGKMERILMLVDNINSCMAFYWDYYRKNDLLDIP